VLAADRAEHARVGRVAGLALPPRRQLELLEQDPRHLLRRTEHELLARELVRLRLELLDPVGKPRRDLAHPVGVDADADVLHRGEHGRQRQLDCAVELVAAALADALPQKRREPERRRGTADERGGLLLGRRLRHDLDPVLGRELVEHVLGPAGLDQVRGDHRVLDRRDAGADQPAWRGLEVVRDDVGTF
jgi:hypothetical protein